MHGSENAFFHVNYSDYDIVLSYTKFHVSFSKRLYVFYYFQPLRLQLYLHLKKIVYFTLQCFILCGIL